MSRSPSKPRDIEDVRSKTVITSINRVGVQPAQVAREACLVVVYGAGVGRKHNLEAQDVVVGRSPKCDIVLDDDSVSRNHTRFANSGKGFVVRDLGSTNGTFVNDDPIQEKALSDGDLVKIGRSIFKFLSSGNVERSYYEEIYRLTTIDGLTQIYNRRFFVETLEREMGRSNRYHRELSLVMFDIDHFKKINDTYGHLAGDHVLKTLASCIKARIRREDIFARYGGEEFAIVLPEIEFGNARQFAEKIRKIVEATEFVFENTKIPVTISMGVATLAADTTDPAALIKKADEQLYEAKKGGRNCVRPAP